MTGIPSAGWPAHTGGDESKSPDSREEVDRSFIGEGQVIDRIDKMDDKLESHGYMHPAGRMRLPTEILETILYLVDPETFASLVLVSHAWSAASQTPHLYAHHLSRCPSFALKHDVMDAGSFTDASLLILKRKFAQETRRNLFEAYLQPRRTVVTLVSNTTTSSTAFPAGEAFDFVFSPNGHWTLALSSSRVYILDTSSPDVRVRRELKVLRRPVSAAILDDGSTLAVLSSNQHVHVYGLVSAAVQHMRSISLENAPHAVALTPKGDILAVAYDAGIDLYSLGHASPERDWRTIKTERVDCLSFSADGTLLLGTTRNSRNPNTVILSAPYCADDNQELPPVEDVNQRWTSQIIFPNSSRDCSHATLIPTRSDADARWTFTYDRVFESFRAVRTDDLRNGTTYFTGPQRPTRQNSHGSRRTFIPCTLPSASRGSGLVAAGFSKKDVWIYGIPEDLDSTSVIQTDEVNFQDGSSLGQSTPSRTPSGGKNHPARSLMREDTSELTRLPKWQVLVDKYCNIFAKGRRVAEVPGVSAVCWVSPERNTSGTSSLKQRLLIAAPGGVPGAAESEQGSFAATDGGRLMILDFDRTPEEGRIKELVFEVGSASPELLIEDDIDMDTQVAIARRRTIRREASHRRTFVDLPRSIPDLPALAPTANVLANLEASNSSSHQPVDTGDFSSSDAPRTDSLDEEGLSLEQATEVFGGPYTQSSSRSRDTVQRSTSALTTGRQRPLPRSDAGDRDQFRRPGSRSELPHESDADHWVPPPPPYAPKANPESDMPLPLDLQSILLPSNTVDFAGRLPVHERPLRAGTIHEAFRSASRRISSLPERSGTTARYPVPQQATMRTVSELGSSISAPVSPSNSLGRFPMDSEDRSLRLNRRPSTSRLSRRPMSEYVGRMTNSIRRPKQHKDGPSSMHVPPVPSIPRQHRNVSTAPVTPQRRASPQGSFRRPSSRRDLLSSGGSIDVPPVHPANTGSASNVSQPSPESVSMPSAQQVANLSNRTRQPPPPRATRQNYPPSLNSGGLVPAPPRGALGAAGGRSTSLNAAPPLHTPARTESTRNPWARSSPALLRPAAQRLDTIDSISSMVSRPDSRSRSREIHTSGGTAAVNRRSRSVGPTLRLDRFQATEVPVKKNFLGRRKDKSARSDDRPGGSEARGIGDDGKGGKCVIM